MHPQPESLGLCGHGSAAAWKASLLAIYLPHLGGPALRDAHRSDDSHGAPDVCVPTVEASILSIQPGSAQKVGTFWDLDLLNIMFIYRDEYYNKETKEPGVAEIIIAKQRNGPVGTTKLAFLRQWTKFENLAPDYQGPGEY